jgi:hypothetical protein
VIRVSRSSPLIIAVAASALLVAGPAYAAGSTTSVAGQADCTPTSAPASCTSTTTTTTTTTTAPTSTTTTPPTSTTTSSTKPGPGGRPPGGKPGGGGPDSKPDRPGRPAGDRDCADFATQKEAQQYFESIGGSSTNNADRLDENHNGVACESLSDDGDNQDAAATTTGDDGSDATTSGKQVTDVPEGSAQTGGN